MALEDYTIAQLRDLANRKHVQLGDLTLKADIVAALEDAGVSEYVEPGAEEPEEESQAQVEGEPEPEYEEPAAEPEAEPEAEEPSEPVVKAGGYIATDKGWELAENVKG